MHSGESGLATVYGDLNSGSALIQLKASLPGDDIAYTPQLETNVTVFLLLQRAGIRDYPPPGQAFPYRLLPMK